MRKGMGWVLGGTVGLLALVGVAASASYFLREPANSGFLRFPGIVIVHVVLGGAYLALAPFQFVKRIRSRHLDYHRRAGRVLVAIGLAVGATGVFIAVVIPFSGWTESVGVGSFGVLFVFALCKGYAHIRARRVALHREWMIRAFAVGLAIATQRLIFIPALLLAVDPTDLQIATLSLLAFMIAFVSHAALAEIWIRITRPSGVPGAGGVTAVARTEPRTGREPG